MSFLKKLVSAFSPAKAGAPSKDAHLAAFGKHPGWNDHIDDPGLGTDALVFAKRAMYVQGIAGNVDAGAWEALAPDQRISNFRHIFTWRIGGNLLAGRLWSSADGKGRTKYPMIVCAHVVGVPIPFVESLVFPMLVALEQQCRDALTADMVCAVLDRERLALKASVEAYVETPGSDIDPFEFFPSRPEFGPDARGLLSILYEIDREMAPFLPGASGKGTASHVRVPACDLPADVASSLWMRFLARIVSPEAPILAICHLDHPWVDLIVGEPDRDAIFCMQAGSKRLPLASDIPYNLTRDFIERSRAFLARNRAQAR